MKFYKYKSLIFLKVLIFFFFVSFFSCTAFDYTIQNIDKKDDNEFFSNFYPHNELDYEFWLFTGILFSKKNYLFSYSFRLDKIIIENQTFYLLNLSLYDYENKKNFYYEDSNIHPLYQFKVEKEKIKLGNNYFLWRSSGKKSIEIFYKNNDVELKLFFPLNTSNNFLLQNYEKKRGAFVSIPLNSNGYIIEKIDKKNKKEELKGYSIFYRDFYSTLIDRFELFFFKKDDSFIYNINFPKKNLKYSFEYLNGKYNEAKVDYFYNYVLADKNRKYGLIWDYVIFGELYKVEPYNLKNINESFLYDWYESLVFIIKVNYGILSGLGISYIQEFTRDKY
jgi:hypothetical protein